MITKIKYDVEQLKTLNDENLVGLIYDKACELHFGTFGHGFEIASGALKELFATWVLDAEVKNGGFDQFFLNNGIEWAEYASEGLKRIGAFELVSLMEKSIQLYKNQSEEYATKRNPLFEELDDVFFDYDKLEKLQLEYIKANYSEFVVNEG